ncbi:MAG: hypothetical protein QXE81_01635, partial [Desulfurococcaceae archaeon]
IFKLSPILAKHIDNEELVNYRAHYIRYFYAQNKMEYMLTSILRSSRYYIPVKIIKKLNNLGLLFEEDYDKHYKLAIKALITSPVLSLLLFS